MEKITEFCTGCRVCEKICPKKAITMGYDREGFLSPNINNDKCINCNLCVKKCPQENEILASGKQVSYLGVLKDKNILIKSTSGGAFMAFASMIINKGGVVYGCSFTNSFEVEHERIDNQEKLKRLQGSKYVQSNVKSTYEQVKIDLKTGKYVLYSGTPCQIAGLYSYLNKNYENLYTIDLICHGVPSPLMFKKYIEWKEKSIGGKITEYSFRYKEDGYGGRYLVRIKNNNKIKQLPIMLDPYGDAFLKGKTFRESCYRCKYAKSNRVADITIGDLWGSEDIKTNIDMKSGVSLIITNSYKGKQLFDLSKDKLHYNEINLEKVKKYNECLNHPVKRPESRDYIYKGYEEEKYFCENLKVGIKLKLRVSNMIPIKVKEYIKCLIKRG